MKPSRSALVVTAAAMALTVSLTGCADKSGTSTVTQTSTAAAGVSDTDATSLLQAASDAAKQVSSVHFLVEVSGKVPGLPLSQVDGALQVKPATTAQGTARILPGDSEAKFTYIDGTMYASLYGDAYADYGDGRSIYDVAALFDSAKGIPHILTQVSGAKAAGTETVNGQETVKIIGTVPASELSTLTGARVDPAKSVPLPTTLWVRKTGDRQLVRIAVKPATEGEITLTFSQWGEKVSVTKPSVAPIPPTDEPGPGERLAN